MKKFFVLALIALLFTNCTEVENISASDLYTGNYTVNEIRTATDFFTNQVVDITEQFLITINKIDDISVEIIGFANCTTGKSKANASETTLAITDVPSSVCGSNSANNAPSSIIITKTSDGFSFTYSYYNNSESVTVTGTAVKS